MSKIELCKTLLKYIGTEDVAVDRALSQGVISILDTIQTGSETTGTEATEAKEPKPKQIRKAEKPKRNPTDPKRKPFDTGKLRALREGGWSVLKIADEMGVSEQTIRNHMKKEGIA